MVGDFNFRVPPAAVNEKRLFVERELVFRVLPEWDECVAGKYVENVQKKLKKTGVLPEEGTYIMEEPINFPPTYKNIHKGSSYLLNREYAPSYTDRIFHLAGTHPHAATVECRAYQCCYHINLSDHKPVYGQFIVRRNKDAKLADETVHLHSEEDKLVQ